MAHWHSFCATNRSETAREKKVREGAQNDSVPEGDHLTGRNLAGAECYGFNFHVQRKTDLENEVQTVACVITKLSLHGGKRRR